MLYPLAFVVSSVGVLASPTARSVRDSANPNSGSGGGLSSIPDVLNGHGAPGIFNSSHTPDSEYGIYNWCNMPHVRAKEYVKPEGYDLQYVEVIQRHHKRTPYASNTFFKEDISWNCTGQGPYHHGKALDFTATGVYWQGETGTQNPFEKTVGPGFVGSTCQFPAETSEGLDDAKVHGEDLRKVYGDLLGFLPDSSETEKYSFRVTNNVITTQTMGGLVKGLFPDLKEHPAWIQSSAYDSLEPTFSCPAANAIKSAERAMNGTWGDHLTRSQALRDRFNNVSGIEPNDSAGWNTSWDHPYDNLSARQCHGKPLPCSVNNTAICVSQEDANTIYRLGQWEYAYQWRFAPDAVKRSALVMGPWVGEMMSHVKDVISGKSCMKYYHNFAHDGSMAPLLGLLQIANPVWPGMGTEVVFELWKKDNTNYIRVLFNGQPIVTSSNLGTLDMIKLEDFQSYLSGVLPTDPVAACNSS